MKEMKLHVKSRESTNEHGVVNERCNILTIYNDKEKAEAFIDGAVYGYSAHQYELEDSTFIVIMPRKHKGSHRKVKMLNMENLEKIIGRIEDEGGGEE